VNKETLLHKYLLEPDPKNAQIFRYNKVMICLMSLLAEVPEVIIANTRIYSRSPIRYLPFYPAHKGGGAITLGNHKWHSITYTENFFSDDQSRYGAAAYANKVRTWLRMSAHEIGHLNHTLRFRSFLIYLIVFAYQYLKYGHDAAPLEKEADLGTRNLSHFNHYLRSQNQAWTLTSLLTSDKSEAEKIEQLKDWWSGYRGERV